MLDGTIFKPRPRTNQQPAGIRAMGLKLGLGSSPRSNGLNRSWAEIPSSATYLWPTVHQELHLALIHCDSFFLFFLGSAGMVPVTSARWVLPHHTTSVEDPKAPMSGPNLSSTTCGWCKDFVSSNRGLWGLEHEPCPSKSCERVQGFGINLFPNRRERFV